jgi:uncharacterized protein (TIGR03118 family)
MNMLVRRIALAPCLALVFLMVPALAQAQYHLTNLVSNQIDQHAPNTDPLLVNAWGLARSGTSPWWVSDNLSGWATVYDAAGAPQSIKALIPTAGNGPVEPTGNNGIGTPTGIVFNGSSTEFQVQGKPSDFIFATLDGTISAWAPGVNKNLATLVVPNPGTTGVPSAAGTPMFTGLAISSNSSGPNFLYAADNTNNVVDIFDSNFNFVQSFGDPSIPSTFSVFGVQDINGQVYVAYAIPNVGAGGYIDVFNEDGSFVKTLIEGLPLNQAWGMVLAPSNFGPLSNTLLVSNNSADGTINGFNPQTGEFVGTIRDERGRKIILNNLWGVAFGGGAANNGATNELFVTVGPGNGAQSEMAGVFASIVFDPTSDHYGQRGQQ